MTVAEVLDHSSLHRKLDQVKWNEPDNILSNTRQDTWQHLMETLTQTQTMPIQLAEIFWMLVKPQFAKPAMIEDTSCAKQKAPINAYDGRSMKKNP